MTFSITSNLWFLVESMQITALWRLVIWFNFRIFRAECVVSPWIYNSNNKKKKKKKNLSIYSITVETWSLSPVRQIFLSSSHLKGVRAILKIIITFWPGFIILNRSSKSSAPLLLPTFFLCFYTFNIGETQGNWIIPDVGKFAALHS